MAEAPTQKAVSRKLAGGRWAGTDQPVRLCLRCLAVVVLTSTLAVAQDAGVEEDLLSGGVAAAPAPGPVEAAPSTPAASFGLALSALGVEVFWSGYGDVVATVTEGKGFTFDLSHFNPIIGARIAEIWRAELEIEFEHASTLRVEYAFIEVTPFSSFSVRAGRLLMPIGRFNTELHPSFRWKQISRPAMFRDVVPGVWGEIGLAVMGTLRPSSLAELSYEAGVYNGLGYREGFDGTTQLEPFRAMRDNVLDNNTDKAFAGRLGARLLPGRALGEVTVGLSGYTGAVDPANLQRLSLVDFDVSVKLNKLVVRGEIAQTFFGVGSTNASLFQRGLYLEAYVDLGRLSLGARWDYVFARPYFGAVVITNAFVLSALFAPRPFVSIRVEVSQPFLGLPLARQPLTGSTMLAFSF